MTRRGPGDIAAAVKFWARDDAAYITGDVIRSKAECVSQPCIDKIVDAARTSAYATRSARACLAGREEFGLAELGPWAADMTWPRWAEVLRKGSDDDAWQERLREATRRGRRFGGEGFVLELESRCHRHLRARPAGRPPKAVPHEEEQLVLWERV